jgi:hypothetical protein
MQLTFPISLPVLIASCLFATFAILANMISLVMIGKLNERIQDGKRLSYFSWGTEVRKRFKQLYPGSRLVFLLDSCLFLMILCFLFLAVRDLVFG